jgi:hypothetical protein
MTTAAIREKLYDYIRVADDDKIKNIYALFEDQMAPAVDWSEDDAFVAELDERVRRYEAGIDRAYTWDEIKASLEKLKKERADEYNKELNEAEAQIDAGDFSAHDAVKKIFADRKKLIGGN